MDSARWTRIAIGLAVGAVVGVGLYATGQVWPLAAAAGVIAADVVYAGLTLAQTGAWGPMRVAAGLVAFAVATYIGIGFVDFGTEGRCRSEHLHQRQGCQLVGADPDHRHGDRRGRHLRPGAGADRPARLARRPVRDADLVLMPVGIGVNIVLGQTVASALKIPIYLDSIGTILVGVLCGPIAGALTGGLGNILWSYVIPPPFQYQPAAAFAITAVAIGVIAGLAGRAGFLRPRPNRPYGELARRWRDHGRAGRRPRLGRLEGYTEIFQTDINLLPDPATDDPLFLVLGYLAIALVVLAVVGLFALLLVRRDLTAAYVVVAGVFTGIVAALISAPIAAGVFGGVTGVGHRLPGGGLPPGGGRCLRGDDRAGPDQRPDRQGDDLLHRLPDPLRHGQPLQGPLPAGRAASLEEEASA